MFASDVVFDGVVFLTPSMRHSGGCCGPCNLWKTVISALAIPMKHTLNLHAALQTLSPAARAHVTSAREVLAVIDAGQQRNSYRILLSKL